MLQLRTTRARMVLLLSILALLAVIIAVFVLSHTVIHASALPDGMYTGH